MPRDTQIFMCVKDQEHPELNPFQASADSLRAQISLTFSLFAFMPHEETGDSVKSYHNEVFILEKQRDKLPIVNIF